MTALQPLTDAQVKNRLEAYNAGGSLERDIRGLWDSASDIIRDCAREHFGDAAAGVVERHYTARSTPPGSRMSPTIGQRLYPRAAVGPGLYRQRDQLISDIIAKLFEKFADDQAMLCDAASPRCSG